MPQPDKRLSSNEDEAQPKIKINKYIISFNKEPRGKNAHSVLMHLCNFFLFNHIFTDNYSFRCLLASHLWILTLLVFPSLGGLSPPIMVASNDSSYRIILFGVTHLLNFIAQVLQENSGILEGAKDTLALNHKMALASKHIRM